jgi:hypothetical protein
VRVLAFLGQSGDKQKGLDELEEAAAKGTYAAIPAKLFLVNIYSSLENQPERSMAILADLRKEFPTSPFIHMLVIVTTYNHGTQEELDGETSEFAARVANGTYKPRFETQASFVTGISHFKKKEWEAAVASFDHGISVGTVKDPFFTWSYLYRGYAQDVLGHRDAAKKDYKAVLSQIRRWGAHDNAEARLKTPFTADDKEMTKLIL